MYEPKIYRAVMCHGDEEWCKIGRGTDLSFQIWHEKFDKFLPVFWKVSKICTLMGFQPLTVITKPSILDVAAVLDPPLVMFDGTADWFEILRKTDYCFQKWHEEFGKFLFTGWKIAVSF